MEIKDFAEQILFADTLDGKLLTLERYEDQHPGKPLQTPLQPGRPSTLALDSWNRRDKVRFADVRRLNCEKDRGLVLHFFANHELLALELMALALLKFPSAPAKFRRGLVRTLMDEQEHLKLYLQRMCKINVEFGQIPVSNFFWQTIAPMETPLDFVTRLSLTLEQANLDYATHYAQAYRNLGDNNTATILEKIYRDEIGHVKHGLIWFRRWHEPNISDWQAYQQNLEKPLTPARAKGIGFNHAGRIRAGLTEEFIAELEIYTHSKGRCPAVHWFNPTCENHIAHGDNHYTPNLKVRAMTADLSALPMLLCAADDIVLIERRPPLQFLQRLRRAGFKIPEFTVYNPKVGLTNHDLLKRKVSCLKPWGWCPDSARFLAPLQAILPINSPQAQGSLWQAQQQRYHEKTWSASLLETFLEKTSIDPKILCGKEEIGIGCADMDEVQKQIEKFHTKGVDNLVIKADLGAAGQNQIRLSKDLPMTTAQKVWLEKLLITQKQVIVEPRLNKVCDLSAQFEVVAPGQIRFLGWTRFLVNSRGQYRGTFINRELNGLDLEIRKFISRHGLDRRWLEHIFKELATFITPKMSAYIGPLGIDALVYRQDGRLRLKPLVELNPRYTMGRVALHLKRRVHPGHPAVWMTISIRDVKAAGFTDIRAFMTHVEKQYPIKSRHDKLTDGALFTTNPEQAQTVTTVLLVGESLDLCQQIGKINLT